MIACVTRNSPKIGAMVVTASWKVFDDAAVARADDQHGEPGREREERRESDVAPERAEGFLGSVGGRRQPVGAQSDPREDRDQRQLVERARLAGIFRRAEQ